MSPNSGPSLAARALLVVGLMIAFYVMALGIVAALLFIPYAEYTYSHRLHLRLGVGCVLLAGLVLWSIVPRIDRFAPPGPVLKREEQPRLFAALEEVAKQTGQAMPREVFLVPDVNAWVTQRGGWMGFGGRRVMGLGLPLMQAFTVEELRATLAHEFGHFHGGDTRLGPWIYKTRAAIGRSIQTFDDADSWIGDAIRVPFKWYGEKFLRVTHAVSRAQEYAADALAADVVGAAPLASALRTVHATAASFDTYWQGDYVPVLRSGFRLPLAAGFASFLAAPEVRAMVRTAIEEELGKTAGNPKETHPSLRQRVEAIGEPVQSDDGVEEGPRAITLLDGAGELEERLIERLLGAEALTKLPVCGWEDVGRVVYEPMLVHQAAAASETLAGTAPETLPEIAPLLFARKGEVRRMKPGEAVHLDARVATVPLVGAALTLAAVSAGAELVAVPGRPLLARVDGREFNLFAAYEKLRAKETTAEAWSEIVRGARIVGFDLGALAVAERAKLLTKGDSARGA